MAKRSKGAATKPAKATAHKKPAKGVDKKLRDRILGPGADEFGKELVPLGKEAGQVTTLVGTRLLGMVRGLVHGYDRVAEWLHEATAKRLKNVPPEQIVAPNPRIAVPAVQALTYSLSEEIISEMFADLLAADMNATTKKDAHPAFVELIKGITPLEARILKVLQGHPQCEFLVQLEGVGKSQDKDRSYSFEIDGTETLSLMTGINNLVRLGLVEHRWDKYPINDELDIKYKAAVTAGEAQFSAKLKDASFLAGLNLGPVVVVVVQQHGLFLSALGASFVKVCLTSQNP